MADDVHLRRYKLMRRARELARSGEHRDHRGVYKALADDPDRCLLEGWIERSFAHQLDRICAAGWVDRGEAKPEDEP